MRYHVSMYIVLFFFFKQKTAYEVRISDWSSDVCSSDLLVAGFRALQTLFLGRRLIIDQERLDRMILIEEVRHVDDKIAHDRQAGQRLEHDGLFELQQIGRAGKAVLAIDVHGVGTTHTLTEIERASCRERVGQYGEI